MILIKPLCSISILAILTIVPGTARGSGDLEAGLEHFAQLDYDKAIPLLEKALASEELSPTDRAAAGLHLGIIHLAYGDLERARSNIAKALALDPAVTAPHGSSPHVIDLIEQAREPSGVIAVDTGSEEEEPQSKQGLIRHRPPEPRLGTAILTIELDPSRTVTINRVVLRYRNVGETFWFDDQAVPTGPHSYEVELPGPSITVPTVEYYLEAIDVEGRPMEQLGSAATPMVYRAPEAPPTVEAPETRPLHTRWWFWTGTGAAVAGGTLAAILLLSSDEAACAASGDRGCMRVRIEQ